MVPDCQMVSIFTGIARSTSIWFSARKLGLRISPFDKIFHSWQTWLSWLHNHYISYQLSTRDRRVNLLYMAEDYCKSWDVMVDYRAFEPSPPTNLSGHCGAIRADERLIDSDEGIHTNVWPVWATVTILFSLCQRGIALSLPPAHAHGAAKGLDLMTLGTHFSLPGW